MKQVFLLLLTRKIFVFKPGGIHPIIMLYLTDPYQRTNLAILIFCPNGCHFITVTVAHCTIN